MEVVVAQSGGFCWGVERAIEMARKVAEENPGKTIGTYGPLVHNDEALKPLRDLGVTTVKAEADPKVESWNVDAVVLRAHGITPHERNRIKTLRGNGRQVFDGTCPDVGIIHATVKRHVNKGYNVIVIGDAGHAETDGIMGYTTPGKGMIVENPSQVENVKFPAGEPICAVSQSTQEAENFWAIVEALKIRYPRLEAFNTICEATTSRQTDLKELAETCDAIVIIGSHHSANTCRLAQMARDRGKPTYHIENESELDLNEMKKYRRVGITAGASTPPAAMYRAAKVLEPIEPTDAAA